MPFQPSYNRFGVGPQGPLNPRFAPQNQVILSTKTEEILQRSQLKMMPRPMVPGMDKPTASTLKFAGEIPQSANKKDIKESLNTAQAANQDKDKKDNDNES